MGEWKLGKIGTCKCGKRLMTTEPDTQGNYRTHHDVPHCEAYKKFIQGTTSAVYDTVVFLQKDMPKG